MRFRIALAGRALRIYALGFGVGFAFGVDFGDLPSQRELPVSALADLA